MAFRFPQWHERVRVRRHWAGVVVVIFVIISLSITCGTLIWFYHWWMFHDPVYVQPQWVADWIKDQQKINVS